MDHSINPHPTVEDREALDALPDDTLILASGDYLAGGTFTNCWARPIPESVVGDADSRFWQVLVFGDSGIGSLTDAAHIKAWRVLYRTDSAAVIVPAHVVPRGDLIDHDTTGTCACAPTTEPVKRDDGSVARVVIHHALDGREQ